MDSAPWIIGICGTFHDSAAALMQGNRIVLALEEERLTRVKHDGSPFPVNAVLRLLKEADIRWEDISDVAFAWNYDLYNAEGSGEGDHFFHRLHRDYAARRNISVENVSRRNVYDRNTARYNREAVQSFIAFIQREMASSYCPQVHFVRHHHAHAASAYYGSGLQKPVLTLTLDGYGDLETSTVWLGREGTLVPISSTQLPHSLGWVYAALTEYLGFRPLFSEGEVMGLAPYGRPRNAQEWSLAHALEDFMRRMVRMVEHGQFEIDPEFLYFGKFSKFGERLSESAGNILNPLVHRATLTNRLISPNRNEDRPRAILAWSLQNRIEEIVCQIVKFFLTEHPETKGITAVALAGGLAYNIKANSSLIKESLVEVKSLFVCPAAGDAGAALGASMVIAQERYGYDVRQKSMRIDLGPSYTDDQVRAALKATGLQNELDFTEFESEDALIERVADLLSKREVVAWFQGGSEFGPRALGYRSIFLNASDPLADGKVNRIKRRQDWRPTALSISADTASKYLAKVPNDMVSPFMTLALEIGGEFGHKILAGRHPGDGTTRPQTVSVEQNRLLWLLLKRLEHNGGIPVVVNTSFNRDEPIVESPEEALNTYSYMEELDFLVLGKALVHAKERLQPTIRSAQDDPLTARLARGATRDWNAIIHILGTPPNHHKILGILSHSSCTLAFPLLKDFFDHSRNDLREFIANRLYEEARASGSDCILIDVSSPKHRIPVYLALKSQIAQQECALETVSFVPHLRCELARC